MKKLDLMLHAGGAKCSLKELKAVQLPEATQTYFPIPHYDFYQQVKQNLDGVGLRTVHEVHALARGGDRYFGLIQVVNGSESAEYSLVIGLRNSHDKRYPAGFCVGSGVFVCDNLAFSSEIVLARRHTLHIMDDLPNLTIRALGQLNSHRQLQDQRMEKYQTVEISNQKADAAIVQMLRAKAITTTQVKDVVKEWDNPCHPEFGEARNVYRLFNAATETMKGKTPLDDMPKRCFALHGVCDTLAGLNSQKLLQAA